MKSRIAIITWVKYYNQGSFLQAFALQNFLKMNGYPVDILWDGFIDNEKPPLFVRVKGKIVKALRWVLLGKRDYSTALKPFYDKFREEKLQIRWIDSERDLEMLDKSYDIYVCGSDQIWNPCSIRYPFYYAAFSKKKKIAYAPSLGVKEYPETNYGLLKNLLRNFTSLSCRESIGANILSDITGRKDIIRVVDPTLLLEGATWRTLLAIGEKQKNPIVFAYFLTPNKKYMDYAKRASEEKGLHLIVLHNFKEYEKYADKLFRGRPDEFVQQIDTASLVITDSFHGTVFSLLMRTPFITLQRFLEGDKKGQNTRISNLFDMMGTGQMYDDRNCDTAVPFNDFDLAWRNLQSHIKQSKTYLLNAIEQ